MSANGSRLHGIAAVIGSVALLVTAIVGLFTFLSSRQPQAGSGTSSISGTWTGLETRDNSQLTLTITQAGHGAADYDVVQHDTSATTSCGGAAVTFAGDGTYSDRTRTLSVGYTFACPGQPATPVADHYRFDPAKGTLTDDAGVVFRRG